MAQQKLPKSRLGRFARLARVGLQTGRSLVSSKKVELTAERSAAMLGQLRGLATKIGQMASYVDGIVPEQHRETFERSMKQLQAAAPQSAPEEVRALLEQELGHPRDALFASWQEQPIASASIGQVHRATLHDGREVAVKVQHPGIAEALEADLANASLMERMLTTFNTAKLESQRLLEEAKERFREELDYGLEAERQRTFAQLHADHDGIVVPAVIDSHSSRRVLTSEFVRGISYDDARERDEAERRLWCETLWHYVYKANLVDGLFNADPHPGNYLFQDNGKIAFLDYGCIQPVAPERRAIAVSMHAAANRRDEAAFRRHVRAMLGLRGGSFEEAALAYTREAFCPIFESPFRITTDYTGRLVERFKDMANDARSAKNDSFVPLPPGMLFINRLQFGFFSVLARLDAEVDYARVERLILQAAS